VGKTSVVGNLALKGHDDIFKPTVAALPYIHGGHIVDMPLGELFPPEFHPFQVNDDAEMSKLVKSIKKYGIWEPGIARPRSEGGYELVSGNRRKRGCEIAEIPTMPVIIRELDDDSAAIAMVDINLEQRKLLHSEKAWAYRVKLEAMNHRGSKSDIPGQLSVDILCEQTGECKNTIFRLVRLTELVPDLLDKVDTKQLGFSPAVELSYLTRLEQADVVDAMAQYMVKPSYSQAQRMKKASQGDGLTLRMVEAILSEPKKSPDKAVPTVANYKCYFPKGYTPDQMDAVITELLTGWQARAAV